MITHGTLNDAVREMEAYSDRIVVIIDEYKSGRECLRCEGKGHSGMICPHCKGKKTFKGRIDEAECPDCSVGSGPLRKTLGFVPCDLCSGQGTSSIIVPEDAEKRPTTGVITSVGALCGMIRVSGEWVRIPEEAMLHVGDRVVFTLYSGNEFELGAAKNKSVIRILKESEVLGRLSKTPRISPTTREFGDLAEVGMQSSND
jgi:co-chaperonin GroES (HSP10)